MSLSAASNKLGLGCHQRWRERGGRETVLQEGTGEGRRKNEGKKVGMKNIIPPLVGGKKPLRKPEWTPLKVGRFLSVKS